MNIFFSYFYYVNTFRIDFNIRLTCVLKLLFLVIMVLLDMYFNYDFVIYDCFGTYDN